MEGRQRGRRGLAQVLSCWMGSPIHRICCATGLGCTQHEGTSAKDCFTAIATDGGCRNSNSKSVCGKIEPLANLADTGEPFGFNVLGRFSGDRKATKKGRKRAARRFLVRMLRAWQHAQGGITSVGWNRHCAECSRPVQCAAIIAPYGAITGYWILRRE